MKKIAISLLVLALVAAFSVMGACVSGNLCCDDDNLCSDDERSVHELHHVNVLLLSVPGSNVLLSSSHVLCGHEVLRG